MAKRRRGFDRRPAVARPPAHGTGAASARMAEATAAAKRRNRVIGATIGVVVFAFLGGVLGSADPSGSPVLTSSSSAEASGRSGPSGNPSAPPSPTIGGTAPVISGVACDVDEKTTFHVHSHLNIRFGGELQPIPADIGILGSCLYWLHTHSNQGVIHVEAPAEVAYTLGQFFDVWGTRLGTTHVVERTVTVGESIYVFVDRQPYDGDPREIKLGDLVAIEIQVGIEPLRPLPYTFPAELQ